MTMMLPNCWLGRRCAASVVCSMRPAKFPAAFGARSVGVEDEFTNALVRMPVVTSGIDAPATPAGHPEPSGLHPLATFDCIDRNCGRIGAAPIWLASSWLYNLSPRLPT